MTIYNFCHKDRLSEKDEYFHSDDVIIAFDDESYTLAHLLADAGKFCSVTEGRKNGFGDTVPEGWTDNMKIGKDHIYILNKFHHWDDDAWWSDDNPRWGGEFSLTCDRY